MSGVIARSFCPLAANGAALCSREYFHSKRLARRHNGPYDPRELVGERHRDQSRGFAHEKRDQPIAQGAFPLANHAQQRGRAQHEQPPEVAIALFGDGAELFLAAAGILPRRHSEPGGKVAARLENTWVRNADDDRRGGDFADPWNAGQQSADRTLRMDGGDLLIKDGDRSLDRFQMLNENLQSCLGDFWKRRIAFGLFEQFVDASDSLGSNNAEF
jgi:hypothetical protein